MRSLATLFGDARTLTTELLGHLREAESKTHHPRVLYQALDAYYHNSGLYDQLRYVLNEQGIWTPSAKALRNPAHATVEFYVSTIASGGLSDALPVVVEGEATEDRDSSSRNTPLLSENIHTIWDWSNMQANKSVQTRRMTLYGDKWWRISTRHRPEDNTVTRVYEQPIWPGNITDFEADERGFITYVRMDIPQSRIVNRQVQRWTYTEEWSKETGRFRTWNHSRGLDATLDDIGPPETDEDIESLGIDFVPFVQAKFRDVGEDRGYGAFTHALDIIDEANQQATRLAQMLFRHNKPYWVAQGGRGRENRPLPAPRLDRQSLNGNGNGNLDLDDDTIIGLPGDAQLQSLIPNINYAAALDVLRDTIGAIEQHYLPELSYYRLSEREDLSGRAIRLMLSAAISRVDEARGNFDGALVRANKMALTMAAFHDLPGFEQYPENAFEQGLFDHHIAHRDVIPLNDVEEAQAETERMRALEIKRADLGVPLEQLWKEAGYTKEERTQMRQWHIDEQVALEEAIQRRFDRGMVTDDDNDDLSEL